MNAPRSLACMLTVSAFALLAAPAFAADDCSTCNSLSKVAECCASKPGCTAKMAPTSTGAERLNVCVATRETPSKPAVKVTAKECQKQYSSCISRLNARRGEFVTGKGKKRAGKASDWLDVVKQGRAACQSRLKACRSVQQ